MMSCAQKTCGDFMEKESCVHGMSVDFSCEGFSPAKNLTVVGEPFATPEADYPWAVLVRGPNRTISSVWLCHLNPSTRW